MREQLERMGLRQDGDFTLKSGAQSKVKWDIEGLYNYSQWVRIEVLRNWILDIGLYRPNNVIGIRTGGYCLACDIGGVLDAHINDRCTTTVGMERRVVVIDDVMTTGRTIEGYLSKETVAIAVLINRSGKSELDGIPVVTGIFADRV